MLVIGRALMCEPKVILLDEPSLGLAPLLVAEIFGIIRRLREERGLTVLLVEQNAALALDIADHGYVMENGRIVLEGPADALRQNSDIKEFYLGLNEAGARKSYRDLKHYKRRKRWLVVIGRRRPAQTRWIGRVRPRDNLLAAGLPGAPPMSQTLPRIAVIGTGGTISSLGAVSLDVLDYPDFGQKLSGEALLDRFPETRLVADPVPVTFRQVGSTDIGPKDWLELRALIHQTARDDPGDRRICDPARHRDPGGDRVFPEPDPRRHPAGGDGRGAAPGERARHRCRDESGQRAARRRFARIARQGRARGPQRRDPCRARRGQDLDLPGADLPLARFRRARPCRRRRRAFLSRAVAGSHARHRRSPALDLAAPLPRVDIVYSYAGADGALVDAAVAAGARGLDLGRVRAGQPDAGAARRVRARGQSRDRRRAMQPRVQRPGRAAPPAARERHRRRRGFQPAKGPHPA